MATFQLGIKNGLFMTTNSKKASHFEWDCEILENGDIHCEISREYHDGIYVMRYHITIAGYAVLTLQSPKRTEVLKEGYVIPKGFKLGDGILSLSNGPVYERFAYFRDSWYLDFMKKHGLNWVRHQNPNQIYKIRKAQNGNEYCEMEIATDGIKLHIKGSDTWGKSSIWKRKNPGSYEHEYKIQVRNATWVVVSTNREEIGKKEFSQVLYTLKNLKKLKFS